MAGWWLTEALPLAATALLPMALFPLLDVMPIRTAAAAYADPLIYLFLGGFVLGKAFERSGLHRRVALHTMLGVGSRPSALVAGVMLATGVISMWVSNTATAIMMLPIVTGLVSLVEGSISSREAGSEEWDAGQVKRFSFALLLGLAYSASIGGMGTPLGTPPNLQFASNARELFGDEFSFFRWAKLAIPLVLILMPLAWLLLTRVLYRVRAKAIPGGRSYMRSQLRTLGRANTAEKVTFGVFCVAVTLWIGREWISRQVGLVHTGADGRAWYPLTDAGIALAAAIALFIVPVERVSLRPVLRAADIDSIPWSILVLFGGGLSLAAAMKATGVDAYLGGMFSRLDGLPLPLIILVIVATITLLSELASNTAVAATTLPILAAAATGLGVHPYILMVPATFAASCGFMLPVATPPNAIVFATGRIRVREMAHAGILMDVVGISVITLFMWLAGEWLLGIG